VIVGNEAQIIRELSTHKPIVPSQGPVSSPIWGIRNESAPSTAVAPPPRVESPGNGNGIHAVEMEMPSLLEIGRRAAMQAERDVIERVLAQTRWNRRQAARILKVSYKALLNRLKAMEEKNQIQSKQPSA
jgi:two-component system, NtrC family, response regulator AtoC